MTKASKRSVWLFHLLLFGVLISLDQISKYFAAKDLQGREPVTLIPGVLELKYLDGGNTGAAWGMFSGRVGLLLIFTIVVSLFMLILYLRVVSLWSQVEKERSRKYLWLASILVILLAGAAGNIIDRFRLGYVIDFFHFTFLEFPIFNLADCYVVVSTILMILFFLFWFKEEEFELIFKKVRIRKSDGR